MAKSKGRERERKQAGKEGKEEKGKKRRELKGRQGKSHPTLPPFVYLLVFLSLNYKTFGGEQAGETTRKGRRMRGGSEGIRE